MKQKYVKCIDTNWFGANRSTKNKIYTFPDIILDDKDERNLNHNMNIWTNTFTEATEEEYLTQEGIEKVLEYNKEVMYSVFN